MIRLVRPVKVAAYVGLLFLVLIALFLMNNDESEFNPELRDNILSDYDYYMDEYKDVENGDLDEAESLFIAQAEKVEEDPSEESLLAQINEQNKKDVSDLVIVVVEPSDEESTDSTADDDSKKLKPLDSPSEVPETNSDDVLRENDIMVDGVVIDKSEELYEVK